MTPGDAIDNVRSRWLVVASLRGDRLDDPERVTAVIAVCWALDPRVGARELYGGERGMWSERTVASAATIGGS